MSAGSLQAADPTPRLSKSTTRFSSRTTSFTAGFLQLARDGTYRQINRERTTGAEVDRGTWEQSAEGTLLLHLYPGRIALPRPAERPACHHGRRPSKIDAMLASANAIRRWLAPSGDVVFAAENVDKIAVFPLCSRLLRKPSPFAAATSKAWRGRSTIFVRTEQTHTFRLTPVDAGGRRLLVQEDAVFQAADLPRVLTEYPVRTGRPPFYFAQVDAGTFAREAGSWQELR